MPPPPGFAVAIASLLSSGALEHADSAWLQVEGPGECRPSSAELAARVDERVIGQRDPASKASVVITAQRAEVRVDLTVRRGDSASESKTLVLPDCQQATQAATLVLALALGVPESASSEAAPTQHVPSEAARAHVAPSADMASPNAAVASSPLTMHTEKLGALRADRPVEREPSNGAARNTRATLTSGVDVGTLSAPTMQIGLSVTVPLRVLEVRGVARYGVPQEQETQESALRDTQRSQFGAVEVGVCRGQGARWNLSVCVGSELSAVHETRRTVAETGSDVDTDEVRPRLGGVLTALLARRTGSIQPELEASGVALAWGRQEGAPWAALRLGAGASVEF